MDEKTCTKCGWAGMVDKCPKCGSDMGATVAPVTPPKPKPDFWRKKK